MSTRLFPPPIPAMAVALLLLLMCSSASAITPRRWESLRQPAFQQLDTDAAPLEQQLDAFAQDRDGFIWLLAGTTLWRWDAYQFTAASVPKDESTPIVQTLASDADGAIWAGTAKGLFRIVQNTSRLQRVNAPGLGNMSVEHILFESSQGRHRAFLAGVDQLTAWDMRSQSLRSYSIGGAPGNRIHALQLDAKGRLWVGTTEGLMQVSVSSSPADALHRVEQWPAKSRVASLFVDRQQRLWVGTSSAGLFLLDQQGHFRPVALPAHQGSAPWIYCIEEIRPGLLWLGTFGSGILEYDVVRGTFKEIRHNRLLKTSLADDNVRALFRDQRGLVWAGGDNSISLYDATQTAFTHLPGDMGASGLSDARIHSVLAMPDGQLWLGTGKHGIDIVDPFRAEVGHIATDAPTTNGMHLSTDPVEAMLLAGSKTVLASSDWLTAMIDRDSHAVTALHPEGRAVDAFSSDFALYRGSTWVGGTDGLWRLHDFSTGQATNVLASRHGELRVSSLLVDGDVLWVGTWKGLLQLQADPAPSSAVHVASIGAPALDQQFIASMAIDDRNRLWLATTSAGLFFNSRDGIAAKRSWGNLTKANGLPANNVTDIQVDASGGIWASTSRGIAHVDPDTLDVTGVLPNQGAAAAPYIRASGAKDTAGEIVFGGLEGLTIVQPSQWHPPSFKPGVVLTGIETNAGPPIVPETLRDADGESRTHLSIAPGSNRLTFEFAALDYVAAGQLRYRYRLLGFDPNWRETDAKHRTASFTSLPPDAYRMQVQASYDGHVWQGNGLTFVVDVAPAWYQQMWFRILLLLSAGLLLIAAVQWRTKIYRDRQIQLEKSVAERTAELHLANQQLQEKTIVIEQISLTDPLTGLRNRRFLALNIEADVTQTLRRHHDRKVVTIRPPINADLLFFLVDIDFFKRVNDQWGHPAGDAVLVEMRNRLMRVFNASDYLIRWGGEEFLAVARGTSREAASEVAERIRQAVCTDLFTFGADGRIGLTCSIGFTAFPFIPAKPDALSWSETLAIADAALYEAKHLGRNTWVGVDTPGEDITDQQIAEIAHAPVTALQIRSLRAKNAGELS